MAGHSKWANIKHKKAASDAVKGKVFSKLAKEIMVAARVGGGDPGSNITLRTLVQKAKQANMPNDNIDRAIKKGTGELESEVVEEITYEGFAPGGVSVIASCLTDNRNRTAADVRHVFSKHGGNLGQQGSVVRSFSRKGEILIPAGSIDEEKLYEVVIDAGAEDVSREGDYFEVLTSPSDFGAVLDALSSAEITVEESEVTMIPDLPVAVKDRDAASKLLAFVSALEDLDDVQHVYSNFDIEDALLEEITA